MREISDEFTVRRFIDVSRAFVRVHFINKRRILSDDENAVRKFG